MNKFSFVYGFSVVLIVLGYFTFCDGLPAYPDEKVSINWVFLLLICY